MLCLIAMSALASACGGDDLFTGPALLECNVLKMRCQESIYASVAEAYDVDPDSMPPIRWILASEFADELEDSLEPEALVDDPWTVAWRLMGFIPDNDTTLAQNIVDDRAATVWAYYDLEDQEIVIIDRNQDPAELNPLLAHEFAHAIQDQQFRATGLWDSVGGEDAYVAARSAVEGDATYAEWMFYYRTMDYEPSRGVWRDIHGDRKARLLDSLRAPSERFTDAVAAFPYVYGFEFFTGVHLDEGLSGRRTVLESLPRSTAAVMRGYSTYLDQRAQNALNFVVAHPSPAPGYELYGETPLGMWYLYSLLIRHGASWSEAWDVATSLTEDSFATYEGSTEVAAVWRLRFDGANEADIVEDYIRELGESLPWESGRDGNDVYLLTAQTGEALAEWAAQPLDPEVVSVAALKSVGTRPPLSSTGCLH